MRVVFVALLVSSSAVANDNAAWALALQNARSLPSEVAVTSRWVHITDGKIETMRAVSLAWNYLSRASTIIRPAEVKGEDGTLLLRFDLRRTAPRDADLAEHLDLWENLEYDPRYSRILTKDTLAFAGLKIERARLDIVPPYVHGGVTYTRKWQRTVVDVSKVDAVRLIGRALDEDVVADLCCITGSNAPVVSHSYLVARGLGTIEGKGLFKLIYGGKYYEFAGIIPKAKRKGQSDAQAIFEKIGIADGDVQKLFDRIRSDKRTAIFRSGVTGKPRRVDVFRSPIGRVSITFDVRDESIDIGKHPIFNLLAFKPDGGELIYEIPNGLDAFVAVDGEENLVREVPFDIAIDTTIPAPHSRRLQPAISCIRCHGPHDGWMPLTNDAAKLVSDKLDIWGDTSDVNKTIPDVIDRLAGLYAGSPRGMIERGKDDYAAAVLRATGPWKSSATQADVVQVASRKLGEIWNTYYYDLVTPAVALADLGHKGVGSEKPSETLKKVLPLFPDHFLGIVPEDPRIAALTRGIGVNRIDWDLVRDFAATRYQLWLKENRK